MKCNDMPSKCPNDTIEIKFARSRQYLIGKDTYLYYCINKCLLKLAFDIPTYVLWKPSISQLDLPAYSHIL